MLSSDWRRVSFIGVESAQSGFFVLGVLGLATRNLKQQYSNSARRSHWIHQGWDVGVVFPPCLGFDRCHLIWLAAEGSSNSKIDCTPPRWRLQAMLILLRSRNGILKIPTPTIEFYPKKHVRNLPFE